MSSLFHVTGENSCEISHLWILSSVSVFLIFFKVIRMYHYILTQWWLYRDTGGLLPQIPKIGEGEGEVAVFSAKRWDRRSS